MMTMAMVDMTAPAGDDGGVGPRADRPRRRSFTAAYKAAILAEYEAAEPGGKGAILRREGLYSSHLIEWRRARDAAVTAGLSPAPRTSRRDPLQLEVERLLVRAEKAEAELARTKAALEIVGKAHALLELLSGSADAETERPSKS